MIQVHLVVTVPEFKFKVASIRCLVLDRKEYSVWEPDHKIFASDCSYLLSLCRLIWLSNSKVYNRSRRSLYKANHYIVVDASIDREHNLMIADVVFPVEDPCIDSISLREDLCCELNRAAGRASRTYKVFQYRLVPCVETILCTISFNSFILGAACTLESECIAEVPEILIYAAHAALPLVYYWCCSWLYAHC